jgi:hypothetical protein
MISRRGSIPAAAVQLPFAAFPAVSTTCCWLVVATFCRSRGAARGFQSRLLGGFVGYLEFFIVGFWNCA